MVCTPVGLPAPPAPGAIELWPNPAPDGRYHLRGASVGTQLEVCDSLGRLVWHGPTTNGAATLDLSPQAPGLYWLRLTSPDGRSSARRG